jgi:hypothetical protein
MRTCRGVSAVLLVAALAFIPWLVRPEAAAASPNRSQLAGGPAGVLVVVRTLTWSQAAAAARAHGGQRTAGLVSTLPPDASLQERVLSLAAGRPVDARALGPAGVHAGQAAFDRMRADNPDASFGALPRTRVLAAPGMDAAGLLATGSSGVPPPPTPLPPGGGLSPGPGELLAVGVADAAQLDQLLPRLVPGAAGQRVLVVGLESSPERGRTAPFLSLGATGGFASPGGAAGGAGPSGVATSDSTRRQGLVAFQDVRPTLTGSETGTQGAPIRTLPRPEPLAEIGHLDDQVASLVRGRGVAVVLYVVLGSTALAASLLGLLLARAPGAPAAAGMRRLARGLLLPTLAIPSGYLLASALAPSSWAAWLLLGLGASVALAVAAWLAGERIAAAGGAWVAPALLGALLTGLVVADLLLGGAALSRPLLGNSAFDGERFYGLGNGYFAHAMAGIFLVAAFRRPPAWAVAAMLAGLAVVDGLPALGADVGGALTAMLAAAAAWLLLSGLRPSAARVVGLLAAAAAAAVAVAIGAGLALGPVTHGGRIGRELLGGDPGTALRAIGNQLSGNFGLLAQNIWAWFGPLLVVVAGLISVRPPELLRAVPEWVRRVVGTGALASALLIVLNDTGVTAAAGIGLALLSTLAWSALEPARAPGPIRSRPSVPRA